MNNQGQPLSAEEKKRKRLLAWKRKQEQQQQPQPPSLPLAAPPKPKVSVSLSLGAQVSKKKKKRGKTEQARPRIVNPFEADDEADDDETHAPLSDGRKRKRPEDLMKEDPVVAATVDTTKAPPSKRAKGGSRWDTAPKTLQTTTTQVEEDALDQFMEKLQAGAVGNVTIGDHSATNKGGIKGGDGMDTDERDSSMISVHVGASMMSTRKKAPSVSMQPPTKKTIITAEELLKQHKSSNDAVASTPEYGPNDWLSDAMDTDDEEQEEQARRALIQALTVQPSPFESEKQPEQELDEQEIVTAADVKNEKNRRKQKLEELEKQAQEARLSAQAAAEPDVGRYLDTDAVEEGVMEEAERSLQAAKSAPDALTVLAELNKKKELKTVDHSKIEYIEFTKNLYLVPRSLANMTNDEVLNRRAKLKVRVRGHGAPAPVLSFEECGLSERILSLLRQQGIEQPFPVQAQCIPIAMAGRDVIGIAKTGSGKTLAYLLPLLRHILVQPPLQPGESGPIGLIMAPARELAFQIHSVAKRFAKQLGLKSTAVYGGAGVAEQIGDLKRGAHIVVATPGRLIDILTMQSGKILNLKRVTFVVLDECDRIYDMGFAPQISAVMGAIRPDRQTVCFSATFPKAIEALARKSLKYPVEVIVGGRSVASDNVTQYAEVVEEDEKFLRLLQVLGDYVEGTKKAIVFVDTQIRADNLFSMLLRNGYPALSLHGGKEQEDRDSTISDFKRKDGPNVLVATGVAGRGLDVPLCCCVINYSAPNHLEAYVHQIGRTGRAGNKGVAYTFVNSTDEEKFAPIVTRALSEAGQSENISPELKKLSDDFKAKVEKGEARYAGSGFKGKGYTYDSSEMTEAQRLAKLEKRQALIEAGLLDPDDEDPTLDEKPATSKTLEGGKKEREDSGPNEKKADPVIEIPKNLTPEILALPGMKEALLRKAGISAPVDADKAVDKSEMALQQPVQLSDNHWLQELEINDYPREARWKVTQKETTLRMQEEFRTAVTLKGSYFASGKDPSPNERRLYLHLEATSETILRNAVLEIQRLLSEETLKVSTKAASSGSHKYNVLA